MNQVLHYPLVTVPLTLLSSLMTVVVVVTTSESALTSFTVILCAFFFFQTHRETDRVLHLQVLNNRNITRTGSVSTTGRCFLLPTQSNLRLTTSRTYHYVSTLTSMTLHNFTYTPLPLPNPSTFTSCFFHKIHVNKTYMRIGVMKDSKTKVEEYTHLTYTGLRHSCCHTYLETSVSHR